MQSRMVVSEPDQRDITLLTHKLSLIRVDQNIYVSIPDLSAALELESKSQLKRTRRNFESHLCQLELKTPGGRQRVNCVALAVIEAWLSGIRAETLDGNQKKTLSCFLQDLSSLAQTAFAHERETTSHTSLNPDNQETSTGISQIANSGLASLPQKQYRALLAQAQQLTPNPLYVSSFEEDIAFRESCLADDLDWDLTNAMPRFISSNNINVFVGHPDDALDLAEAHERIGKIGLTTVLAARIALALWNLRRHNHKLTENGSVPISIQELLEWKGIQKHSRPAYPGASTRVADSYETKHKQQLYRDFYYLQQCYMRGQYQRLDENGSVRTFLIDGPYARVSVVRERNTWGEEEVVGFIFSPGDWIATAGWALGYFAVIDRQIFQLHPQHDQHALRIALYLVERWCQITQRALQESQPADYGEPISMYNLLRASMIPIDPQTFRQRSVERIEQALQKLFEKDILGASPVCIPSENAPTWREQWLTSTWRLVPPASVVDQYEQTLASLPPPSPPRLLGKGGPTRRQPRTSLTPPGQKPKGL